MRFAILLKKELREVLPWVMLAAVALLLLGSMAIHNEQKFQSLWNARNIRAGESLDLYELTMQYPLYDVEPLVITLSIGLAIALGLIQFMVPFFRRNWAYMIHRSIKRTTILWAKFTAATIAMAIGIGLVWTMFYLYACRPERFPFPPSGRVLLNGWLYILLSMVVYFAMALTAIGTRKWYITRAFPLLFVFFVYTIALSLQTPLSFTIIVVIAATGYCVQIVHTFINKEF